MKNNQIHFRAASIFLGIILWGAVSLPSAVPAEARGIIRVLIFQEVAQIKVSGQDLLLQDSKTGEALLKNPGFSALAFERESGPRLRVRGQPIFAPGFLLTSSSGSLAVNGRTYRDKLKIFPGGNKDLWGINELPLEEYLVGVVTCEISPQWPLEALKAQAVVARTYALFQKGRHPGELYDLDSTVNDQVYEGTGKEDARSRQAVKETEGELLLYQDEPIFAVYHSCCGGKTELSKHLWAVDYPYLKSTVCNYCLNSPFYFWNSQVDPERLRKSLANLGSFDSKVIGIEILERSESQRVLRLSIKGEKDSLEITGKDFRRLVGYDLLRSTNFVIQESNGNFLFSGGGWGHGTGLCQWGAKGLAETGVDYQSILKYYYQNVEIGRTPG